MWLSTAGASASDDDGSEDSFDSISSGSEEAGDGFLDMISPSPRATESPRGAASAVEDSSDGDSSSDEDDADSDASGEASPAYEEATPEVVEQKFNQRCADKIALNLKFQSAIFAEGIRKLRDRVSQRLEEMMAGELQDEPKASALALRASELLDGLASDFGDPETWRKQEAQFVAGVRADNRASLQVIEQAAEKEAGATAARTRANSQKRLDLSKKAAAVKASVAVEQIERRAAEVSEKLAERVAENERAAEAARQSQQNVRAAQEGDAKKAERKLIERERTLKELRVKVRLTEERIVAQRQAVKTTAEKVKKVEADIQAKERRLAVLDGMKKQATMGEEGRRMQKHQNALRMSQQMRARSVDLKRDAKDVKALRLPEIHRSKSVELTS